MPHQVKARVKARYFCEQCGAEVRAGAAVCPSCGSRFTAVRCPECGYEGRAPEFRDGCPVCGYRAQSDEPDHPPVPRANRKTPVLPARFYSIAMVVLGALVVGLVVLLLLRT